MDFKKAFKNAISLFGATALLSACITLPTAKLSAQAVTSEEKTIDMYLLAGQSNAAGYSSKGEPFGGVFENVRYAGEVDRNRLSGRVAHSLLTF